MVTSGGRFDGMNLISPRKGDRVVTKIAIPIVRIKKGTIPNNSNIVKVILEKRVRHNFRVTIRAFYLFDHIISITYLRYMYNYFCSPSLPKALETVGFGLVGIKF